MAETPGREPGPARLENDPGYQSVVKKLETTAVRLKTPVEEPDTKVAEVRVSAELPPARQNQKNAYNQQLDDLAAAPIPTIKDFTVEQFIEAFQQGFAALAKQLPKANEDQHAISNAIAFGPERAAAVREMKSQSETASSELRTAASRNPMELAASAPAPAPAPDITRDPAGPVPGIAHAAAAAPKPKAEQDISLDKQSQALDDSLNNQVAGGQVLNISEASLALPVSGEKSFDEAGEAKRKAQEQIRKLIPSYRAVEDATLKKARRHVSSVVNAGLHESHGARQHGFDQVYTAQKGHERTVETAKDAVLSQFQTTYNEKKKLVDGELASLNGVADAFDAILTKAETELKSWVRQNLEYIYTPGFFDYSDWIDERRGEVEKEYERLAGGRTATPSGYDKLSLYMKALTIVRDRDAAILFAQAKQIFSRHVTDGARDIAVQVVGALNRANQHIRAGQERATQIYSGLSTKEQAEYGNAFAAVMGQYASLAESVADRHREIVGDMARSYHKTAGTLQATFEAIKKDVLTSWFEKAWNKIKAVVNAIIEFATRIAELLGKMIHLLGDIISSPRYFFNNLVTGIGRGLTTFVERIDEFLIDAFFDWLRGSTGVSIQMPKDWDAKGIFSLFTQLLNLSTETIWQRMEVVYDKTIANAFRRGEVLLEKGLELFAIVKNEGLAGLWTHIKESLGTILTDTLESMKETVLYAAIKKVMIEIGKLLVPGGGFIAIAEKVIRLLQFIVEARNKILDLIESFVESLELAVNGDVSGIVTKITGALKAFITVALDFLVAFFGLGGLKSKVERVIDRMRSPIIRGIDWVLGTLKSVVYKVAGLVMKGKERVVAAGRRVGAAVLNWLGIKRTFIAEGEAHTLFFKGHDSAAQLWVASDEIAFSALLVAKRTEIAQIADTKAQSRKREALSKAGDIYQDDILRLQRLLSTADESDEGKRLQAELNAAFNRLVPFLVVIGVGRGGRLPETVVEIGSAKGPASWVESKTVTKHKSQMPEKITVDPAGWVSHIMTIPKYDDIYTRLHLVHFSLGGPNNSLGNTTAGRKSENLAMYNQAESKAIALVHEKQRVLWYRAEVTRYRSEQGYTDFAEGIRVRYGFKERNDSGEWVKVSDVSYDNTFAVTKPGPKGTQEVTPTINSLTFDYWDDELKKIPNAPRRDVYRTWVSAKNARGGYSTWAQFIGAKEFAVAQKAYGGDLEAWFKSVIAEKKLRNFGQ